MLVHNITIKYKKAEIYKAFCKRSHFATNVKKI